MLSQFIKHTGAFLKSVLRPSSANNTAEMKTFFHLSSCDCLLEDRVAAVVETLDSDVLLLLYTHMSCRVQRAAAQ